MELEQLQEMQLKAMEYLEQLNLKELEFALLEARVFMDEIKRRRDRLTGHMVWGGKTTAKDFLDEEFTRQALGERD